METQTNKPRPVVSVILPTQNRANKLKRAVQSVLGQTYRDYELIIVDDGSNDDTPDIASAFKDDRILFLRHQAALGAPQARNTALRACNGEYVAFLDDDDEWLATKLARQMSLFSKAPEKVGVVYTAFEQIEEDRKSNPVPKELSHRAGDIHAALLEGNFITLPSVMIRKKCLETIGLFDEEMPRLQDWEFLIRLSKQYHFMFINEPLLTIHCSKDSISGDDAALAEAMELILKKNFNDIKKNTKLLIRYYIIIANLLIFIGQITRARVSFIKAIKKRPWDIRITGAFLASFLGRDVYSAMLKMYKKNNCFR
jgi:glycosyltransferase involved in cell wall biosynthesis